MTQSGTESSPASAEPVTHSKTLAFAVTALVLGFGGTYSSGLVSTLMSAYLTTSVLDLLGTADPAEVGYVGSYINALYIVGWAIGGILFGWLGDRAGRARTLSLAMLVLSVFTLAVWVVPDWQLLVLFRFLTGMGVGGTMVMSAVYIAEVWGDRVRGRAIALSIIAVGFPIGIIFSGVVTHLAEAWRTAFLTGALPLAISMICFLVLEEPDQWSRINREDKPARKEKRGSITFLLAPENRVNFFVAATIFGSMLVGIWATFSWLPTWAQNLPSGGAGLSEGGNLVILLGLGGIIGSFFAGFLANGLGRRKALMLAFGGASLAASLLYLSNSEFTGIVYVQTAFLSLFFGISQAIFTAYIPELFPAPVRSTATGICFNAGRFVTATAVFFVGILVPVLGGYGNSLLIFSVTYLVGFITVWFGSETRGKVI
jgi:MFS family permease